jgi:hypothetical protein
MDNISKIYLSIALIIVIYTSYQAINIEKIDVSDCCKKRYSKVIDRKDNPRYWCLGCRKWCKLTKVYAKKDKRSKRLD